jgi:MerR family transcriptional regulator, light-induced transcriptional regulator
MSTTPKANEGELTIAAVARQLGIAPSTLRTWDRRYGMGPSKHKAGTHRKYSAFDLVRLTAMYRLVMAGVSPCDAASKALKISGKSRAIAIEKMCNASEDQSELVGLLYRNAMKFDQANIEKLIRGSISKTGVAQTWQSVLVPLLTEVGNEWQRTGFGIEVEHLVSEVIRKILSENIGALAKPINSRPILLACVGDERHSLALTALAAVLAEDKVQCIFLGASTPQSAINLVVIKSAPPVIFLWAQMKESGDYSFVEDLPVIRPAPRVILGGPGWAGASGSAPEKSVMTSDMAGARVQILQAIGH